MILESTYIRDFVTNSPTSGATVDADALPTAEVFEDDNDTPILTPVVTKRVAKTGNYRVELELTSVNGFEKGKSYSLVITAVVGGITGKGVVANFSIESVWNEQIEGTFTPAEVMRLLSAYVAGKTTITDLGGGNATVVFRDLLDRKDRITGSMVQSDRTAVVVDADDNLQMSASAGSFVLTGSDANLIKA